MPLSCGRPYRLAQARFADPRGRACRTLGPDSAPGYRSDPDRAVGQGADRVTATRTPCEGG